MPAASPQLPWQLKCAIDSAKALLPFQRTLRQWKDRAFGYQRNPAQDAATIRDGLLLTEWLGDLRGMRLLEIGSGWQPMLPLLFSLAGARVFTADLHRLLRLDTFRAALDALRDNRAEIAARLPATPEAILHAARECHDLDARLDELNIRYLAPCDCRALPLEAHSLDIVTSRAVLEHVPREVIAAIFAEARRVLRPGGRVLHLIDYSDHWSHRDTRISAVNFLKFSERRFRWTCLHPQNYQNRLRHPEYVELLESAGFRLLREHRISKPGTREALATIRIDPRFHRFHPEDLAITGSILLAEPLP
ncbi:MAG: methyltransferase domain-containing protein [Bryobacteraceae bacterium]|nr:methyltransferase domain-containing protein [Bryobacteraceae bacterium]